MKKYLFLLIIELGIFYNLKGQSIDVGVKNTRFFDIEYNEISSANYLHEYVFTISILPNESGFEIKSPNFFWKYDNSEVKYEKVSEGKFKINIYVTGATFKNDFNEITYNDFVNKKSLTICVSSGIYTSEIISFSFNPNIYQQTLDNLLKSGKFKREDKIIQFTKEINQLIQEFSPFSKLILPIIFDENLYPKISKSQNSFLRNYSIKSTDKKNFNVSIQNCINTIYSTKKVLSMADNEIITLLNTYSRKSFMNNYQIKYLRQLVGLINDSYLNNQPLSNEVYTEFVKFSIGNPKYEKKNEPDELLVIVEVKKDSQNVKGVTIYESPWITRSSPDSARQSEEFSIKGSPSYKFLYDGKYVIWINDIKGKKISRDFSVPGDSKSQKIFCDGREFDAIIDLTPLLNLNINFDKEDFHSKLNELVMKYRYFYIHNLEVQL